VPRRKKTAATQRCRRLTNQFPRWSPSGEQIAFESNRLGPYTLWTINSDGTGIQQVLSTFSRMPSWHPSGKVMLYVTAPPGETQGNEVYTLDLPTGATSRITWKDGAKRQPLYSPDGSMVIYQFSRCGPEVWIANPDGTDAKQLTTKGGVDPAWSPDGTHIVYTRWNIQNNDPENGVLWILEIETGEEARLTTKWPNTCP